MPNQNFKIDDIPRDSALGQDLHNAGGVLILGKGTVLTESVLTRLKKMGVGALDILVGDPQDDARRDQLLLLLEARFRSHEDDAFLQEIKRVAAKHISERPIRVFPE